MKNNIFELEFKSIGTDIYIQIVASQKREMDILRDFQKIKEIYREKEIILSRFNSRSELSKLNSELGTFHNSSKDIVYLAKKSLIYYKESEGVFDPRILINLKKIGYKKNFSDNNFSDKEIFFVDNRSSKLEDDLIIKGKKVKFLKEMDFSGIAKGYITDEVAKFLLERGWKNFLVDSGGDMFCAGVNRWGDAWGISLEGTENEDEILINISKEGLATSGNTRKHWQIGNKKFHHLINPINPARFNFDLKSVTVIAKNTETADIWAKVLFILGIKKGTALAKRKKIKSIFLKENKEIIKLNI